MRIGDNKKVGLFLAITFGLSWTMAMVYWLVGGSTNTASTPYFIMTITFMFTPMISALLVQKLIFKQDIRKSLGVNFKWNRWWTIAWLLPLVIALATMGVGLLFPSVSFSLGMEGMFDRFEGLLTPEQMDEMRNMELPVHPFFITLIQGLIAALTINAVAGFGEELGWRGILYESLKHKGFWRMSLIIGLIWGIWHAPIILMGHNYPENPITGIFMMIAFCILFSPIFTLIREKSGSVIAASILHGGINALGGTAIMLLKGGNELLIGLTGLAGFTVLIIFNIMILIYLNKSNKLKTN
ncbi:CPBP family intramembrane glutamic endopeptidase [Perlabentimonas gracilis]|jgi:membrane protease YdiL (CAAX protease family)|uniref:CPBP family intramembrane glutamic endopeptidase n=1 Tax=Perlabentimonas gracilis TaxID=2715279 RepID=UPI00140BEEC2|nr:CPBP family intramembrane glutamic endopeptidase [Perlabentimonas gracilis]NHB67722.1 CPBP family intramembrane metalloprotease [Perlabentimonas gracilis]